MFKLVTESLSNENDLLSLSLDEIARAGAKKLLAQALALEVEDYIKRCSHLKDDQGHRIVVRNGKSKSRKVTLGSGTVEIKTPRINDNREGFKFNSMILPPYARKSKNIESILPILYLKGLSGNAFYEALQGLLGEDVAGLSSSSIATLKKSWVNELNEWKQREITDKFIYIWADGVHVKVRLGEDKKHCLLVLMGVTTTGEKKLIAVEGGYRESKESWKLIFKDLLKRGMNPPLIIIGDGALGLWAAINEVPELKNTKEQRCWVHKIANVLDKLPKRLQPKVKSMLHDMMNSETEQDSTEVFKEFQHEFHKKYPKAVKCLVDDWEKMIPFYNFPAEHWQHIRTTNPIESTFATVKLRTKSMKGAGSKEMAEAMCFKLMKEAEKRWQKIRGHQEIEYLLSGRVYKDGEILEATSEQKGAIA